MANQTVAIDTAPRPETSSTVHADRGAGGPCRHRDARDQHPAAVAAADGGVAECHECRGHLGDHDLPCGIRARPARGRADLGPLRPTLAGADRVCRVLCRQRLVRPCHRPAGPVDRPRHPGGRRLRHLGAVARHCPRHVLRRGAGPRDGADHDRDGGRPRLLAAARRRARSLFRLAIRIRVGRRLCRLGALAYNTVFGETHHATRTPLDPLQSRKTTPA